MQPEPESTSISTNFYAWFLSYVFKVFRMGAACWQVGHKQSILHLPNPPLHRDAAPRLTIVAPWTSMATERFETGSTINSYRRYGWYAIKKRTVVNLRGSPF
jgi:hypothetical protein